ncbi:hypothetical protein THRCLA_11708 [Thraustotheca clavata]|uniref:BHLH domain-containing protein n=1 Tax=Thraustotheca clavata TaxID=74557 RepID=A0A1V9Y6W3_9STRA|nr:hypothetical protein THRCLA_11708 [Thraustotheca clavata]
MDKPSTLVAASRGDEVPRSTGSSATVKEEEKAYQPMHINLNVINNAPPRINTNLNNGGYSTHRQDPFGFDMDLNTPCESPVYSDVQTPGGSVDISKKQRHNLREQRRIFRIGTQFEQLKKKLEGVGFVSAKKDKHSILQATIEYIAALEREAHSAGIPPPPPPSNNTNNRPTTPATLPRGHSKENVLNMNVPGANPYMFNTMASPVPTPMAMEYMWALPTGSNHPPPVATVETVEESTATFKNVFAQSSMPALITKLDGTIVEANHLFMELSQAKYDELRLHSLYTMCAPVDAPKMHNLVAKILSCEVSSAQAKMTWRFGSSSHERKVFVSVSVVRDDSMQPVNIQCSILPLS